MHFYCPEWMLALKQASERLTIGAYCTLCARPATNGIDLCECCEQQFVTGLHTYRDGHTTEVCLSCGAEHPSEKTVSKDVNSLSLLDMQNIAVQPAKPIGPCCTSSKGNGKGLLIRIVAPYRYAYPVDRLVKRVKYAKDRQLARVLGTLLGKAVIRESRPWLPDLLLPMPLHPKRQRRRGFNQALDIARWAGKYLQIEVAPCQVSRIVDTGSLAGLNRVERQLRILGAFRAGNLLHGKRVAIVDDVLTTGASARELARELYDSGADSVELWVFARTSSSREAG